MLTQRLETIRKRLMAMREELLGEARRKNAEAADLRDEGVPDVGDQGTTDNLGELLHLLGDAKREEVLKIDDALLRLNEGNFGVCQECGEEIDLDRLELRPYTRFCTDCKSRIERQEAVRSGPGSRTL